MSTVSIGELRLEGQRIDGARHLPEFCAALCLEVVVVVLAWRRY
jgi:hypothetical protein